MSSSVKMGKLREKDICVANVFRVIGLEALRVVDMSIAPIIAK